MGIACLLVDESFQIDIFFILSRFWSLLEMLYVTLDGLFMLSELFLYLKVN